MAGQLRDAARLQRDVYSERGTALEALGRAIEAAARKAAPDLQISMRCIRKPGPRRPCRAGRPTRGESDRSVAPWIARCADGSVLVRDLAAALRESEETLLAVQVIAGPPPRTRVVLLPAPPGIPPCHRLYSPARGYHRGGRQLTGASEHRGRPGAASGAPASSDEDVWGAWCAACAQRTWPKIASTSTSSRRPLPRTTTRRSAAPWPCGSTAGATPRAQGTMRTASTSPRSWALFES